MLKVLVVGQTPPPFMGQAISIQIMLNGKYKQIRLYHVRMAFSKEIDEIGKFRLAKLWHLLTVIISIVFTRFRYKVPILYYVPSGPDRIPMYRDLAILISTRWLFKKTVFHFRAAGISELYRHLSSLEQFFFRQAYFNADLTIRLSEFNPMDGEILQARKNIIIPNGLENHYSKFKKTQKRNKSTPILLFVGILSESKGVLVLLHACRKLKDLGFSFKIKLMGEFESNGFCNTVKTFINTYDLGEFTEFLGLCVGDIKWKVYREADIFVFPSYFASEALPRVVLEAIHFELPVVATRWRGIPSMVENGKSGFLVPIKDSQALAEKIAVLLKDPKMRISMAQRGRRIYLERFTVDKFWRNMEKAFLSVA